MPGETSDQDFEQFFKHYDKSNDGRIDYKELSTIITFGTGL